MKKKIRILLVAIAILVLACGIAVGVLAADNGVSAQAENPWQYVTSSGETKTAATFSEAVAGAGAGKTVTLLSDCTEVLERIDTLNADGSISSSTGESIAINKALTVDLGGHTYYMVQEHQSRISIKTTSLVTIKNGTIVATGNSVFGSNKSSGYAIIRPDVDNTNIALENLNTYSGCVVHSAWNSGMTLTITGGEHYLTYDLGHCMGGGLVESRRNVDVTVTGAKIYVGAGKNLMASMMYSQAGTITGSKFKYIDCQIIALASNSNLLVYANEYTDVTFDGCTVYGKIEPTINENDASKGYTTIPDGIVKFTNGTKYGSGSGVQLPSFVTVEGGEANIYETQMAVANVNQGSLWYDVTNGSPEDATFSISEQQVSFVLTKLAGTVQSDMFIYEFLGQDFYTDSLNYAIEFSEGYIKLPADTILDPATFNGPISKNITFDLNGYQLTVREASGTDTPIYIAGGVSLTVKNGKLVAQDGTKYTNVYSVFEAAGDNVTLTVTDLVTRVGSLINNGSYKGLTVNINGGSHSATDAPVAPILGYIQTNNGITVNAKDAILVVDDDDTVVAVTGKEKAVLNFVGCTVASYSASTPSELFKYLNEHTEIIFDDCIVYGIINPTPHESDTAGAMKAGSIKVYGNTMISNPENYIKGGVIAVDAGKVFAADEKQVSIQYERVTSPRTYKPTLAYVLTTHSSDAVASYVSGAIVVEATDLKEAISLAAASTTITLFRDVTLTESEKNFSKFENDITLDLGGHTIKLIQQGEAHFGIYANVTIKNGSLMACMDSNGGAQAGKSYPMLCYGPNEKGLTLTLDKVNTYGGSMVFAWNCSGHKLNVIGGTHIIFNSGTGNDNGWLDVRGDFVLNASGARFVTNNSSWVVSALSFKDTDTTELNAYFNFTDCTLASYNGKGNLIGYANEYSHFEFNACDIYGSINPSLNTNDKDAGIGAIKAGAIVIGSKTRMASLGTNIGGGVIVLAPSLSFVEREHSYYLNYNRYTVDSATGEMTITLSTFTPKYTMIALSDEEALYTVTFYKEDGVTVLATFKVAQGAQVTPPAYVASGSNGFFSASYNGWTTTFASNEAESDFTVYGDVAYYPAVIGSITADFSAGFYNLTLVGKIRNNLYIPKATGGVKILGVYDSNGQRIYGGTVNVNGTDYSIYMVGEVGAAEISRDITITIKYSVGGAEYSHNITLNAAKYARNVLKDSTASTHVYNEAAYTLVADLVRYSNTLSIAINGKDDEVLKSLLDSYSHLCSSLPTENSFSNYVANTTGLAGIIESIQLEVSSMEPKWRFNIASGVSVEAINISVKGYLPKIVDGVNYGTVNYGAVSENGGKVFYTENIPMYNLDRLMTIEVILANGSKVYGTYNLDAYFAGFEYIDTAEDVKTFLKAFRAFAVTSSGYKYGDIVMDEKTGCDFFECEHKDLGAFYIGRGRFCADCGTSIFFYSDYGAVADGVSDRNGNASGTNDYMSIYDCHAAANVYRAFGAKVAVMAVGGVHNNSTYYIGAPGNESAIIIKTDVNLDGANFIVDDRTVSQTRKDYYLPVFKLEGDYASQSLTSKLPDGISAGTANIGFAPGVPMMIYLIDNSQQEYIREGVNNKAGTGVSFKEIILVDEHGNVNKTTPIQHDYHNVPFCKYGCTTTDANGDNKCDVCAKSIGKSFAATGYRIDDVPITVSGLDKDGNVNFTWENLSDTEVIMDSYDQCQRVIRIERSNATVQGIDHYLTEGYTGEENKRQTYAGIVNTQYCNNVVIRDMLVYQHEPSSYTDPETGKLVGMGSYEFSGTFTSNISWINCKTKNLFWSDGTISYRGLFGTNYMRNMYFKDCVLNSMDSHTGAYNITMENSVFEHVNYVGGGDVIMKNITIYTSTSNRTAVSLRQDYGAHWKGNIYMDGITIRYVDGATIKNNTIDLIRAYYTNHYFGMDTYLPINVYANNIKTQAYKRTGPEYTFENGTIVSGETITSTNKMSVAIYDNINSGMTNDYDYSTVNTKNKDPKHCTENIYLSNIGPSIVYPDHPFFEDMNVYVDGVLKTDWFVKRSGLNCTDQDGDNVCETCFKTCSSSHTGNIDGKCSACGATIPYTCIVHTDENNDKACDKCKEKINCASSHAANSAGQCSSCGAIVKTPCSKHTDENGDYNCEVCYVKINCTADHSGNENGVCSSCQSTIQDTGGDCVTGDTLVTLADGTTARVDSLKDGDMILAWNFETGKAEAVPIGKFVNHGYSNNTVIALQFEGGTVVKVVNAHQFFNVEANDFVTIKKENAESYIGKYFASLDENGNIVKKQLVSCDIYEEYNEAYAIVSALHYSLFVEGMLTMDMHEEYFGMFRAFEIGDNMMFDKEQMAQDIETYGLYTYEDFEDYLTYEQFVAFNVRYMKVAVGKGKCTEDMFFVIIDMYLKD